MSDPVKFAIYGTVSLLLLVAGFAGLAYKEWVFAGLFIFACGAFVVFATEYSTILEFSHAGIRRKRLPGVRGEMLLFSEIKEVGIIGTNVFNPTPDKGNKTGVLYMYFSPRAYHIAERRKLVYALPRNMYYMRLTDKRYEEVCRFWEKEIVQYNTGDGVF